MKRIIAVPRIRTTCTSGPSRSKYPRRHAAQDVRTEDLGRNPDGKFNSFLRESGCRKRTHQKQRAKGTRLEIIGGESPTSAS